MIVSMTGFGSATADRDGLSCSLEIRAVNNRYLKLQLKLPDSLDSLEPEIDRTLRQAISRGSVTFAMKLKVAAESSGVCINPNALAAYLKQISELQTTLAGNPNSPAVTLDLATLLNLPGICEQSEFPELGQEHHDWILQLVRQALEKFQTMRAQEGAMLWDDLSKHLNVIQEALVQITAQAPQVAKLYHEKLRARVLQMVNDARISLSDQDLLKEVALFADRADISEEITRLNGHLSQFFNVCQKEAQAGRKLDFISQEMLREANTIGSKANDALIGRLTVDIKSAIDRIKEQVQNIE